MEILINELSLQGQYDNEKHFIRNALTPFVLAFNEFNNSQDQVYKIYDLYNYKVTPTLTFEELLRSDASREYDIVRKFKSLLYQLLYEDPFWQNDRKHSSENSYLYENVNLCEYSLAEACERDRVIISFPSENFNKAKIGIYKNGVEEIVLDNLFDKGHYNELNRERKKICIEEYCVNRFKGSKLDFSQIDDKLGFGLIKKEDENLFIDAFKKFTELSWTQINVDNALDYKPYPDKNKVFKYIQHKVHKFRVSEKYRCFGYTEDGLFYVLRFDLEHKLSD